jgi:hypothetical protein
MSPLSPGFLLAQLRELPASGAPASLDTAKHSLSSLTITVIVIGGLTALLILWAVFIRKSPKERQRGRLVDAPAGGSGGRRRRRRKDKQRGRNPTRAEVGGLPPIGSGDSANPPL